LPLLLRTTVMGLLRISRTPHGPMHRRRRTATHRATGAVQAGLSLRGVSNCLNREEAGNNGVFRQDHLCRFCFHETDPGLCAERGPCLEQG
jgi:hypothetical protein